MLNESSIKQIFSAAFILSLFIFAYLIIKPIFFAIIFGLLLAYSFNPVNKLLLKRLKNPSLTATVTCTVTILIIIAGTWVALPILITQTFDSYLALQNWDAITFLRESFPVLFSNPQVASQLESSYATFLASSANIVLEGLTNIISNLPSLLLRILVVLIVFFYGLRDGDKILELMSDSLPFNKSTTNRFVTKSKQITFSVIFGRIIVGIITGILTGIGFFIVGTKNALLLMVLATLASIIPLIGPWIIWVPIVVSLFIAERTYAALFLLIYGGLVVTLFENVFHPLFVSRTSHIATSLTLIGIIGGLLVFGIFGLILGPLIMAYLSILFELYRETKT